MTKTTKTRTVKDTAPSNYDDEDTNGEETEEDFFAEARNDVCVCFTTVW